MIGRLRGTLVAVDEWLALVDVNGLGYEVELTAAARARLPTPGSNMTVCTQLIVREDAQQLFGFADLAERELFRMLIKVSGVGPRMAMGILSGMQGSELRLALLKQDVAALTRLPGVGKKTAERLVMELKDRLGSLPMPATAPAAVGTTANTQVADAESALIALGYKPVDAARAVNAVFTADLDTTELVRQALKSMASQH